MAKYCHERVSSPRKYDKRSFRTKSVGKRGHKIVTGCPKGEYNRRTSKCRVAVGLQAILHPEGEKKCPVAGRKIRHKKRGRRMRRRKRNPHLRFKYSWVGYIPRSKAAKAAKVLRHEGFLPQITKAPFAGWSEVYLRKGRDISGAKRVLYSHGIMVA